MATGNFSSNVVGTPAVSVTGTNGVDGINASSDTGTGVVGSSRSGTGVQGNSTDGRGVIGNSSGNIAVTGNSVTSTGVYGQGSIGVHGRRIGENVAGGIGVYGEGENVAGGVGVYGGGETGIHGHSTFYLFKDNLSPISSDSCGVKGTCTADGGTGVYGSSDGGTGVYGETLTGYAGFFRGQVYIDGNLSATNDISVGGDLHVQGTHRTKVLEILGADVAESFDIDEVGSIEPGNIMIIDDNHPGNLKMSHLAYDHRVAGVVSGALGLGPGVILRADKVVPERRHIALIGRVYCKAEASSSPIAPGDMLTTSNIPGHAMRALDKTRSHGAILGKAMSSLESGTGLVMVLVNLQ